MIPAQESGFHFNFPVATTWEKLDDPGKTKPEGMKLVDFVLEESKRLILLEVKNPSQALQRANEAAQRNQEKARSQFIADFQGDKLIVEQLTPKARDSYTWLHLMGRDKKPMLFVFLLGNQVLRLEPALLLAFKDRLLARLRQETDQPWVHHYVSDCIVLTEQTWQKVFPDYPLLDLTLSDQI